MAHPSVVINNVVYSNVPQVVIPKSDSGTAVFYDASETDVVAGSLLSGVKAIGVNGTVTGNIPSKSSSDLTASVLTVTAPAGYYSSAASKTLTDAALVSGNIKNGATIFGVSGAANVIDTTLASGAAGSAQIVSGYSAFVNGAKVDGAASMPVISQDSTTKVLSIS